MADRTITVGTVTKEQRMIGWRVGWVLGPKPIMTDISLVNISNVVCQVGIAMPGAEAALTTKDDGVTAAVAEWQARRDVVLEELKDLPVIRPSGGWCLLMDTSKLDSIRNSISTAAGKGRVMRPVKVGDRTARRHT
jgi:aspartate/methionine/tyrosine aminotransferase